MSNTAIDKKEQQNKKVDASHIGFFIYVMILHQFHNEECVLHELALSNLILQSFQSIQES